jgi:hypothetical protein
LKNNITNWWKFTSKIMLINPIIWS